MHLAHYGGPRGRITVLDSNPSMRRERWWHFLGVPYCSSGPATAVGRSVLEGFVMCHFLSVPVSLALLYDWITYLADYCQALVVLQASPPRAQMSLARDKEP